MRISSSLPSMLAMVCAGLLSVAAAVLIAGVIERASDDAVSSLLLVDGQDWAKVSVDGLQVRLTGTAPDEATRFRALSLAGSVVDAARVRDRMQVDPGAPMEAPRFSIEILRNGDGISLIGLVPGAMDRAAVVATITELAGGARVTDLLEAADYPVPGGWAPALSFALDALAQLPRSKISVAADRVEITAISGSVAEKRRLETKLSRAAPNGIVLALDISAPRPVITPFTVRFLIDDQGVRFDACSAHTAEGRARILAAAAAAGLAEKADCTLGLGVPSPRWPDAVSAAIAALKALGGGTLTFSDADVSLVALAGADPATFDRVVGELEAALPDVFSLQALLPKPVQTDGAVQPDGPPDFVATFSPEGLVQLRGRIGDDRLRNAVEGFARAQFGGAEVSGAMRLDESLPTGWPTRVLASLEALSLLNNGSVLVQPDFIEIKGDTGDPGARAEIARILSGQLGAAEKFAINVSYHEALDPVANLPTPEECVNAINAILTARKLTFEPGSPELDGEAFATIDRIAEVLTDCSAVQMEIAGHTDSQGRETMNQQLSQQRAETVLQALMARRVLTGNLDAKGYGESQPIADNGTEAGREANRRIEFTLVVPEPEVETGDLTGADAVADPDASMEPDPAAQPDPEAQPAAAAATPDEGSGDEPQPEPETGSANEQN